MLYKYIQTISIFTINEKPKVFVFPSKCRSGSIIQTFLYIDELAVATRFLLWSISNPHLTPRRPAEQVKFWRNNEMAVLQKCITVLNVSIIYQYNFVDQKTNRPFWILQEKSLVVTIHYFTSQNCVNMVIPKQCTKVESEAGCFVLSTFRTRN